LLQKGGYPSAKPRSRGVSVPAFAGTTRWIAGRRKDRRRVQPRRRDLTFLLLLSNSSNDAP
jgi:hypothetical protein